MATYDEVITALRNADAAGDVAAAQRLAQIASQMRSQPAPETPKPAPEDNPFARGASSALKGFVMGGPIGAAVGMGAEGWNTANKLLDQAAFTAGGKAAEGVTALGGPPEAAGVVGSAVNTGIQALPMLVGGEAAKAASPALESTARTLMQSAVKPTRSALSSGKAERAIDTMLERGIPATETGVERLTARVGQLEKEITGVLENSPQVINKHAVATKLNDAFKKLETDIKAADNRTAIYRTFDEFLNHPLLSGSEGIPVALAHQIKQALYKRLSEAAYGVGVRNTAEELAQKTLARGLREAEARQVPEVAPLLAEQGDVLNALRVLSPRVAIEANKNPVGLGLLASSPLTFAAWMAERSAGIKSGLARLLYSGSERIPETAGRLGTGLFTVDQP